MSSISKDSFVMFLDILGYSNVVKAAKTPEALDDAVKLLEELKKIAQRLMKTEGFTEELKISIISDSIVLSIPYAAKYKNFHVGSFFTLILAKHWQREILKRGFLSRGYITRGLHYHNDAVFSGGAFIKSYEEEKRVGHSPIVVVDPKIISEARSKIKRLKNSSDLVTIESLLRNDNYGRYFVDYLAIDVGWTEEDNMRVESLAKKNFKDYEMVSGVKEKWFFLLSYLFGYF